MVPFIDETPLTVIIQQSQHYTKRQLRILHDDPKKIERLEDYEIMKVYNKAYRLEDENALTCLINKYPIKLILSGKNNGLPDTTKKETESSFDQIYNMIKTVYPDTEDMSDDERKLHNVKSDRRRNKAKEENRIIGGKYYRECFEVIDGQTYFYIRTFLRKIAHQHLICVMKTFPDYNDKLYSMLNYQQIDWICEHNDLMQMITKYIRTNTFSREFPIEDLLDMESGKVILTTKGRRY